MNSGLQRLKKITKNRVESILLLEAALDKDTFLDYILNYFDKEQLLREVDFSSFNEKLSENEFQQLHYLYHFHKLWDVLEKENFTPQDAKEPLKWLSITFQAVQNDIIKPYYLAFVDNSRDGKNNIIEALRLSEQGNDKKLFEICRAILRRMFGNITERRGKGVYQDIPFAISWWKVYLSKEISITINIKEKDIIEYFLNHKTHYNDLIANMNGKLTVIADKSIRDSLMAYIINKNTTGDIFKDIMRRIGIESSWRAMGSLDIEDNKKIIESLVA